MGTGKGARCGLGVSQCTTGGVGVFGLCCSPLAVWDVEPKIHMLLCVALIRWAILGRDRTRDTWPKTTHCHVRSKNAAQGKQPKLRYCSSHMAGNTAKAYSRGNSKSKGPSGAGHILQMPLQTSHVLISIFAATAGLASGIRVTITDSPPNTSIMGAQQRQNVYNGCKPAVQRMQPELSEPLFRV